MRTIRLLGRILPLVLSFTRDHRRWVLGGGAAVRTDAFHRRRADRLVATIAAMGPTFIKLAQLVAGRRDLIPSPYIDALATLTDRVPAAPWPVIRRTIEDSYGHPVGQVFESIDPSPLATASLGQVHRARVDGREVVVKVLRPNVEATVEADIAAARRILRAVVRRWPSPHLDGLLGVLDEFERRVADEMDFRQEARFARQVRENLRDQPSVRVPEVLEALTRRRVLVLEYVAGTRIDRLEPAGMPQHDPERILRAVMELYVRMMLVDGLFHADPHPGNILVDEAGRVVLLDFGMVVDVPVATRRALGRTVFAAIRQDVSGVVDGFYALGLVQPTAARETIHTLAAQLITLANERTTAQERIARVTRLADEVVGTLYDFPVQLPPEMVYFARTAALIEGLGVRYDARFNPVGFATPIALKLRGEILRSLGEGFTLPPDVPGALGAVAGYAVGLFERVAAVTRVAAQLPR